MSSMPSYAIPSSADDTFGGGDGSEPRHHVSASRAAAAVANNNSNSNNNVDMAAFDPSDVDKLLAGHLQELSVQDREGIAEEIHGVATMAKEETAELIRASLIGLEAEISRIPNERKTGYIYAIEQLNSHMVFDQEIRLKFLRADLFDVQKAAVRFVDYWDMVRSYFGDAALARPLLMNDLGPKEREVLREGPMQLVGARDRFGRLVVSCIGDVRCGLHWRHAVRVAIYLYGTVVSEDVETQRKGMVICIWPEGTKTLMISDKEEQRAINNMMSVLPIRISAAHICLPKEPASQLLQALLILAMPKDERTRTRIHLGKPTECRYNLMTFGLPVRDLPITDSGRIKIKFLTSWIKTRQTKEEAYMQGLPFKGIEVPLRSDVLFCNGGQKFLNPGNTAFRSLLEERRGEYTDAKNSEKRAIIADIIQQVGIMNGRFLLWDAKENWWEELPLDAPKLMDRVSTALRDHYKRLKEREAHLQFSKSSTSGFLEDRGMKRKFGCFVQELPGL